MLGAIIAIGLGAALGALSRWGLGLALNALFPPIPPGTVAANLIGAYVIGVAIAYFAAHPSISPEWRLFIITGFCGGLTTFSTFSAELVVLLQEQRLGWALAAIGTHLGGSVAMTMLGMASYLGLKHA
ncbi:Putative fluoride ion transporter CrcB [Pigmentiphaga humi]|uniref:Fluoride-specific ion channel FluC n=1 Tax=Pigmentiphaga humi TaxID=2478468 RepID=A0A3P4B2V7_9BURK|nr:fluoride efflux transporter CrcB [Pigmentiphaga humi]VCU69968.1 Putative fluoride ion transporter CrcB [Pigmentiphaga humi]